MKNTSIFQGWKEFEGFRFESDGSFWNVYERTSDNCYYRIGRLKKKNNETNKALFQRAKDLSVS